MVEPPFDRDPVLYTGRLLLRPLEPGDSSRIQLLANDYDVASMVLTMPYPYPPGAAQSFIEQARAAMAEGRGFIFGILRREDEVFMGTVGIHPNAGQQRAEVGYWLGKPYWGQGYMTEAVRRVIRFGFEELKLNKVHAACYRVNVGSARVLEKAGMTYEGTLRQHFFRMGKFHDGLFYGVLRDEWLAQQADSQS